MKKIAILYTLFAISIALVIYLNDSYSAGIYKTNNLLVNTDEVFDINNYPEDISELLYGKWKIIEPYAILPDAFDFNRYESFEKYQHVMDDPLVAEIVKPYENELVNKIVEFSKEEILFNDQKVIDNPLYVLEKREGNVYSDNVFNRYRPFHDYFNSEGEVYYYFETANYKGDESDFLEIKLKGFIVAPNYIVCPINDDWIYYVLERQE